MKLSLFPTSAIIRSLGMPKSFDDGLYEDLLKVHGNMALGEQIWDRQSHNIFDGSVASASELSSKVMPIVADMLADGWEFSHLQGREVVRTAGMEIMPHNDEDECHIQAVYFPSGPELDDSKPILEQVNQYGANGFALCNPAWRSSGFGGVAMPWESPHKFWVKPHRGLLIAFDARTVHFQKTYMGEKPFMQILFNIKVQKSDLKI